MEQCCYREIDGHELTMDIFRPAQEPVAAILMFHGGGWRNGGPEQFHPLCEALAADGLLACSARYRLLDKGAQDLRDCIADARAAVAWMREQPGGGRLAVGGGSAGGHLAACCGLIDPQDGRWPEQRADALVLLNPVIDQGPGGYGHATLAPDHLAVSPMHHIGSGAPPCCFLLGTEDNLIPVETATRFQWRYQAAGGRCDLHLYGGQVHGFHDHELNPRYYRQCLAVIRAFVSGTAFCDDPSSDNDVS